MNNEEKILALLTQMNSRMDSMEPDISGIKVRLDVDIERKFNLLAEGQQTILETLAPKSRVEALEDEMAFMKQVVKAMGQELAELKKAQ